MRGQHSKRNVLMRKAISVSISSHWSCLKASTFSKISFDKLSLKSRLASVTVTICSLINPGLTLVLNDSSIADMKSILPQSCRCKKLMCLREHITVQTPSSLPHQTHVTNLWIWISAIDSAPLACCGVVFTFFTPVSPGPAARTRIIYILIFCHQNRVWVVFSCCTLSRAVTACSCMQRWDCSSWWLQSCRDTGHWGTCSHESLLRLWLLPIPLSLKHQHTCLL